MKRLLFSLLTLAVLAAACAPPAPPPTPTGGPTRVDLTPAQLAAIQALAEHLSLPVDQIKLVSTTAVEWPDSCLGVPRPEARCAMMITPGFRHALEANGRAYDVHTNQDGSASVVVAATLTWERQGGIAGFCDTLTITRGEEVSAATCGGGQPRARLLTDLLTKEETQQWSDWLERFGAVVIIREDPAVADQLRVQLTFAGRGDAQPTEAEQQAMLDLAQSLYERAK